MDLNGPALLEAITYLPCIRSRPAEIRGYSELRATTKASLHPLVALGKLGRVGDAERVMETLHARVGPCFLDLNLMPGQGCDGLDVLYNPEENFRRWREFASGFPGVIPVALMREDATERHFLRQVISIEQDHQAVVIRTRRPSRDLPALSAALSAVEDVNNILFVLDLGYVRAAFDPKTTEARRVITALRSIDPAARIAVVGSSYPRSVAAFGDRSGTLEILERDLHLEIGGNEVAVYGDHASIYPEPYEPSISRWVPRIDYCLEDAWKWQRRRQDEGGYVRCAQDIIASADWDAGFAAEVWGAGKIAEAGAGQVPQGFGSPANWIAARVNMHIERQTAAFGGGAAEVPYDYLDDLADLM